MKTQMKYTWKQSNIEIAFMLPLLFSGRILSHTWLSDSGHYSSPRTVRVSSRSSRHLPLLFQIPSKFSGRKMYVLILLLITLWCKNFSWVISLLRVDRETCKQGIFCSHFGPRNDTKRGYFNFCTTDPL